VGENFDRGVGHKKRGGFGRTEGGSSISRRLLPRGGKGGCSEKDTGCVEGESVWSGKLADVEGSFKGKGKTQTKKTERHQGQKKRIFSQRRREKRDVVGVAGNGFRQGEKGGFL